MFVHFESRLTLFETRKIVCTNGSSCDRCHAGKRNVVILPIAEIADCTAARTHPGPKGANTGAEHRPLLALLLSFPVRRAECHLLDNVRRVYLDTDVGNTDRGNIAWHFKRRRAIKRLVLCNFSARILRKRVEREAKSSRIFRETNCHCNKFIIRNYVDPRTKTLESFTINEILIGDRTYYTIDASNKI